MIPNHQNPQDVTACYQGDSEKLVAMMREALEWWGNYCDRLEKGLEVQNGSSRKVRPWKNMISGIQRKLSGKARSTLMAPHPMGGDGSFVGAFLECSHGLEDIDAVQHITDQLDDAALRDLDVVRRAINTTGVQKEPNDDGLWIAKVRQMTEDEKHEFSRAVDNLATCFHDAFNEAHPD